jgi:hypothetical protein
VASEGWQELIPHIHKDLAFLNFRGKSPILIRLVSN